MKVYDLMNILKDLPAGMEVIVCDQSRCVDSTEIVDHEVDGDDSEGYFTLFVRFGEEREEK